MKTRDRIIYNSIVLFNEKGTINVTTNHIAEYLGISPGNLYYHFRNKEEIIRAIFHSVEQMTEELWLISSNNLLSFNTIQRYVEITFTVLWKYHFLFRELPTLLRKDPELETAYRKLQKRFLKELDHIYQGLSNAGFMKKFSSPDERQALVTNSWIIGNFWCIYLGSRGEPTVSGNLRQGLEQINFLLKPYFEDGVQEQISRIISQFAAKLEASFPDFVKVKT